MFFDWLSIEQDFGYQLPIIGDLHINAYLQKLAKPAHCLNQYINIQVLSYCDSVLIKISGSILKVSGNPSRWGRIVNKSRQLTEEIQANNATNFPVSIMIQRSASKSISVRIMYIMLNITYHNAFCILILFRPNQAYYFFRHEI